VRVTGHSLAPFIQSARSIFCAQIHQRFLNWHALDDSRLIALELDPSISTRKVLEGIRDPHTNEHAYNRAQRLYMDRLCKTGSLLDAQYAAQRVAREQSARSVRPRTTGDDSLVGNHVSTVAATAMDTLGYSSSEEDGDPITKDWWEIEHGTRRTVYTKRHKEACMMVGKDGAKFFDVMLFYSRARKELPIHAHMACQVYSGIDCEGNVERVFNFSKHVLGGLRTNTITMHSGACRARDDDWFELGTCE
jgi:hypothetical protein